MKKTKIVCTLGPSSSSVAVLKKMLLAGMNVARFNFSHGTHESHKKMVDTFRRVRDDLGVAALSALRGNGNRDGHQKAYQHEKQTQALPYAIFHCFTSADEDQGCVWFSIKLVNTM